MLRTTIVLLLCAGPLLAQEPGESPWLQDFAKAKARAKAANKDLLVNFTGSDWCTWCKKLDAEVFAKPAFQSTATDSFVLVKLDYPEDPSRITPAIKAQNAKLQQLYPVQGFPTILLMDADGRVYGQAGYQPGGAEAYNTMLADLHKKGNAFKAAMQVASTKQGLERAAALEDGLSTLDEGIAMTFHFDTMQEIVALDPEDKAGLKSKYETTVKKMAVQRQVNAAGQELQALIGEHMQKKETDQALKKLDAVIESPKNKVHHQMALFFRGMVLMEKSDAKAAVAALEEAKALLPDSPIASRIAQVLPGIRQQVDGGK